VLNSVGIVIEEWIHANNKNKISRMN